MSSTRAPQQPSPFDLPTELVIDTLVHLPPPTILLYIDPPLIEKALFAVSLVSKRFHALSGDLVWRHTTIAAPSSTVGLVRAKTLVARWPALAQGAVELVLRRKEMDDVRRHGDWADVLPGVERIVPAGFNRLKLIDVARFRNLRHLSLVDCTDVHFPQASVFPRLESMRLMSLSFKAIRDAASPGIVSRAFPVLRHLAVDRAWFCETVEAVLANAFLGQLDSLEVSSVYWWEHKYGLDVPPPSLPTLWRIAVDLAKPFNRLEKCLEATSIPHGQHLLLEVKPGQERDVPVSVHWEHVHVELRRLVALHAHSRLRLVLVSGAAWHRPEATPPELAALEALESDCAQRGVVLRPCELPRAGDGALPEFIAFLREEAARARS